MAKLPASSIQKLNRFANSFKKTTKIQDFTYEAFESRAEELERLNPEQGYQLAYRETMVDLFRKLFDRYAREEKNLPTLKEFVQYYDTFLMKGYVEERKAQGMAVNIRLSDKGIELETLEALKEVLDARPALTITNQVNRKFESGELTLDNTYDIAKAKAKSTAIPERKTARELVAYAAYLENRNKARSFWQMLGNLWTHFKERSAIKTMRSVAERCGSLATLTYEASVESTELKALRDDVSDGVLVERDRRKPWFSEAVIAEIESVPVMMPDESDLDQTLDLGDVESDLLGDALSNDDAMTDSVTFSDESIIEEREDLNAFEKVEFNEEDIDIFPKDREAKQPEIKAPAKDEQVLK